MLHHVSMFMSLRIGAIVLECFGSQQLRAATQGAGAEFLLDLVHGVAQFVLNGGRLVEKTQLLRIAAIAMQVAGGDAKQANFLLQRKLREQSSSHVRDFFAGSDELVNRLLFCVRREALSSEASA